MKARGILRHCFHGDYHAVIGLAFENPECVRAAQSKLGENWELSPNVNYLVWAGNTEELDKVKKELRKYNLEIQPCGFSHCQNQCKNVEIDSLAHSVDYGPGFSIEI